MNSGTKTNERGRNTTTNPKNGKVPPEAKVTPTVLLLRAVSGSVVLMQPGSVLMSGACVTTEDLANVCGVCCNLKPCRCLGCATTETIFK